MVKLLLWVILACISFPIALLVAVLWVTALMVVLMFHLVALVFGATVFAGALTTLTSLEALRRWRHRTSIEPATRRRTIPDSSEEEIAEMRRSLGLPDRPRPS